MSYDNSFLNVPPPQDLVVLYRGNMQLVKPVPSDINFRTQLMKMHAKKLQNEPGSRFVIMHIDSQSVRLYTMDQPRTLLLEINGRHLDLVKQSKRDTSFFYFTTRQAENDALQLDSEVAPAADSNQFRYVCHVFHGSTTKTADKAHRLIRQFVDENKPSNPSSLSEQNLLLCIDETPNLNTTNSPLSMFDHLAPSSTVNKPSTSTKPEEDLLGDLFCPPLQSSQPAQWNPFIASQPAQWNPFVASQPMAPPAPPVPARMPASNPFSSMATPNAAPNSHRASQMTFGSEFDSFLSQTIKGQFKSGNNKTGNLF